MRVLFLDLDTLRPDHLGCYGYQRDTSLNLDRIAAEGIRFDNYFCSDAPCLPSRAALMSGRFGIHSGAVGHGGTAADFRLEGRNRGFRQSLDVECLPAVFRRAGMRAVSISPFAERHSAFGFYSGFTEMYNTGKCGLESAEEITPTVLDWIERNAEKDDWFLHVNYWDPHTPYRAPAEFGDPFADDPLPAWLTAEVLATHNAESHPHGSREFDMFSNLGDPRYPRQPGEAVDRAGLRRVFDGYDCGVRYLDGHIGQLLAAFKAKGVLDDLAIIVTADHGENLGELGLYGEHGTADQITCRIPMIIRWPGACHGAVDRGFHYNLDLAPTLAELLGQKPQPGWDGASFAPAITTGTDCGREHLVLSQMAHVCQRSVRFGDWLYIRSYHDGYHLFPEELLFNIADDPHEQCNLAPERPELCREAVYRLNAWHDDMMKGMDSPIDPLWTVMKEGGPFHARGKLPAYCAFLEKTGRGHHVPELRRRHPGEFKDQPCH
jgi:arylsulfatase A-like enzyme